MINKKIHIFFCGELRYFEKNFLTLKNYLRNYHTNFLFYPWKNQIEKINDFKKNYINSQFDFIFQNDWQLKISRIKYPDNANSKIINLFYMWDALTQSFLILNKTLKDDDIVLRCRTDVIIHSSELKFDINTIEENTLYIPNCYHWNGLNDQIFFSKVSTLKKFQFFFEYLDTMIDSNNFICPEYVYYKYLKKMNIRVVFFEIDYQILRNNQNKFIRNKTIIPLKDRAIIKFLKLSHKIRNFYQFFIKKKKRNKNQNLYI